MASFEEYRLLYERTEKLSERRQTTSQIYLTINTALFGAVAFLAKDSGFPGWEQTLGLLFLFAFGILICFIWLRILLRLEEILRWQYGQLRELEKIIPDSYQLFTKENLALYRPGKGREKFSFSLLESRLPVILMIIYGVFALGFVLSTALGGL